MLAWSSSARGGEKWKVFEATASRPIKSYVTILTSKVHSAFVGRFTVDRVVVALRYCEI